MIDQRMGWFETSCATISIEDLSAAILDMVGDMGRVPFLDMKAAACWDCPTVSERRRERQIGLHQVLLQLTTELRDGELGKQREQKGGSAPWAEKVLWGALWNQIVRRIGPHYRRKLLSRKVPQRVWVSSQHPRSYGMPYGRYLWRRGCGKQKEKNIWCCVQNWGWKETRPCGRAHAGVVDYKRCIEHVWLGVQAQYKELYSRDGEEETCPKCGMKRVRVRIWPLQPFWETI